MFYGYEPFDGAKATYVWTGVKEPGFFHVEAWGEVRNYTPIVELVRDQRWVGGLKIDVMGWTGPIGEGNRPYRVLANFPGQFYPEIVVQGSNKREVIKVEEIPPERAEDYLKELAEAV
ncbi:MAG TPA: hypothetical protein VFW38_04915 [Solirubrobacteraceae bacterium]|nr:hypothetical protein [Solirubrobacteraceae bacterium]